MFKHKESAKAANIIFHFVSAKIMKYLFKQIKPRFKKTFPSFLSFNVCSVLNPKLIF